jgi:phosphatidylserine decarboxylase
MSNQGWARAAMAALRMLPVNALSRAGGRFAEARLPGALQRAEIRAFGRLFGVAFDEARDDVASFTCFQDFFTRALRDGVRPIDPDPASFVAPCDGAWGSAGRVEDGTILQVKGRPYSLSALLGSEEDARAFEGGAFATFYLSPRDYHRFHAPAAAAVTRARYLPGKLWPVNGIGLHGVDGLFAENERICAHMQLERGAGAICLVAVGATMVGSVRVTFDDLTTNVAGASPIARDYPDTEPHLKLRKGEEWGRFQFGSTIVLVAEKGVVDLDVQPLGSTLRLGTRVGTIGG